jgi:hypothetical protein
MQRPLSYSDSYIILSDKGGSLNLGSISHTLEPFNIPTRQLPQKPAPPQPTWHLLVGFVLKGSLHIFFISSFESIFYFLYVSKSEENAILDTINTYYMPFISGCGTWSNFTHALLLDIVNLELNRSTVDATGAAAAQDRHNFNTTLVNTSILYSVVCLFVFFLCTALVKYKNIAIDWHKLFVEHISFVTLLALYEFFFFRTIIYKYKTVSTPELNEYLVDGFYQCLQNGTTPSTSR